MFVNLTIIVHIVVCMALIMIILLQATKGAGMGAAFGGASQTLFGSTGRATFLTKITIAAAVIFGLTSVGLSLMGTRSTSVMDDFSADDTGMPIRSEQAPVPKIPLGAGTNLPGAVPDGAGIDAAKVPASAAPTDAQPGGLVPDLPAGSIEPPEVTPPASESAKPAWGPSEPADPAEPSETPDP